MENRSRKYKYLQRKIGSIILTTSLIAGCKSIPYGIIQGAKDTEGTINYLKEETGGDSLSLLGIFSYPFHFLKRGGEELPEDIKDTIDAFSSIVSSASSTFSEKGKLEKTLEKEKISQTPPEYTSSSSLDQLPYETKELDSASDTPEYTPETNYSIEFME